MNKAIVTGATGHIASGVVECLLQNNIEVLALGRRDITTSRLSHLAGHTGLTYLQLEMSKIEQLAQKLEEINWTVGDACVFYHFAWSGDSRLADGSVQDQYNNVTYSSNAVVVAQEIGCSKFINAGSQEERFVDRYLEEKWTEQAHHSSQGVYGSAKVSARDMCLLLAYLKKIDYVHTRISVIVEESLDTNNFVNSTIKKMLAKEEFTAPSNAQLFDFIGKEECAKIFYQLGLSGKNKADYFIGTGHPMTMHQYFNELSQGINGDDAFTVELPSSESRILNEQDFDIAELTNDIGYTPNRPNYNYSN